MVPVHPECRALSETLTRHEVGNAQSSDDLAAGGLRVLQRLDRHLRTVLGVVGFQALLDRSLSQTGKQYVWLSGVHTESDGSLPGLRERVDGLSAAEIVNGLASLLACFVQLLASLIGVTLAMRLVQRAWPEIDLSEIASRWEEVDRD